ncbi:MAG: hypothetical protein IKH02_01385 [Prevotella sp.]|nr:hypothetical protein [Prevotella sp.]
MMWDLFLHESNKKIVFCFAFRSHHRTFATVRQSSFARKRKENSVFSLLSTRLIEPLPLCGEGSFARKRKENSVFSLLSTRLIEPLTLSKRTLET